MGKSGKFGKHFGFVSVDSLEKLDYGKAVAMIVIDGRYIQVISNRHHVP
jgi:hypothetical protein